jgi:hypothetical protein
MLGRSARGRAVVMRTRACPLQPPILDRIAQYRIRAETSGCATGCSRVGCVANGTAGNVTVGG